MLDFLPSKQEQACKHELHFAHSQMVARWLPDFSWLDLLGLGSVSITPLPEQMCTLSLGLESAVELRIGGKRAGQFEYPVGPAQRLDLAFQFLDPLRFTGAAAFTHIDLDLDTPDPFQQGLRHAADRRCDRPDCRPERRVLPRCACTIPAARSRPDYGPRVRICSTGSWLNPREALSLLKKRGDSASPDVLSTADVRRAGERTRRGRKA